MLNSEFWDFTLRRCRRAGDTVLRADAILEFTRMLQSWERSPFNPWFLEKVATGLTTVANQQTLAIPTDYLLLVEDTDVFVVNADGDDQTLERGFHEDLENKYANADAGLPKTYDIFANLFYFGPKPAATFAVKLKYFAKTIVPPDDGATLTNAWVVNAEDFCITALASRLVQDYIKDDKRAAILTTQAAGLRAELHKYNEARKHVDMNYEIDR